MINLANVDYSLAHPIILDEENRKRIAPQIMSVLKNSLPKFNFKTASVLDLGCSAGINDKYLVDNFQHIDGIDIDKNAIKFAKKEMGGKKLSFSPFDGKKIPFPNKKFDLIIFRRSFEYAREPEKLVLEMARVLKPSGIVYFEVNNRLFPVHIFPIFIKKLAFNLTGKKIYYFSRDPNFWQLKKLFKKFQSIQMTPLIVKNPVRYNFSQQTFGLKIGKYFPLWFLKLLEPFFPSFIWLLSFPRRRESRTSGSSFSRG